MNKRDKNKFKFGTHMSNNLGLINCSKLVKKHNGNAIQIFINNKLKNQFNEFNIYNKKNNIGVYIHASYTINLARDWDKYSIMVKQFIEEIKLAYMVNAKGIIIHLGKSLTYQYSVAINNMFTSLVYIVNKTSNYPVSILIETSSGQGSEMCTKIDCLSHLYKKFSLNESLSKRINICIDTCHIFAGGYDIRTKEQVKKFLTNFDKLIGIKNIKLIHLNDSIYELNSNRDRHASIGEGKIGMNGLKHFFKFARKNNIDVILETPNTFTTEIKMLNNI